MSQQINLLNTSLIKQKDFLNPNIIAITLGILLALMLGYFSFEQKQLSLLTAQRSQISQKLMAAQATLQQTALLHTPHEMNKALIVQIAQLEKKQAMQQQVLQTVNQSSASPEKGYAAMMRAFAKQSLDGLWLTSFSIDSQSDQLNISGRTLQGELVPEFISRLSRESALKGKQFSALNMSLPKITSSSNTTPAVTLPSANSSTLKASIIKNGVATMPVNTQSTINVNTPQNNEVNYIEFSLQSIDDKSVAIANENKVGGKL